MKTSRFSRVGRGALVAWLIGSAIFAHAQSAGSATTKAVAEALNKLAFMKGEWAGQQEFNTQGGPAMTGEATDRVEVAVGGRYLSEVLATTLPGRKPSDSRHFISFDPASGKFVAWWFNDTSIGPSAFEGELAGTTLVLTTKEAAAGAATRTILRATYETPAEGTLTYKLEMQGKDGAWTRLFTTTYKRKA